MWAEFGHDLWKVYFANFGGTSGEFWNTVQFICPHARSRSGTSLESFSPKFPRNLEVGVSAVQRPCQTSGLRTSRRISGDNTVPRNILESKKLFLPSKFPRLSPEIRRHSLAVREYRQCNALIALQIQTTTPIFSLEFPFHFVLGTCCGQESNSQPTTSYKSSTD